MITVLHKKQPPGTKKKVVELLFQGRLANWLTVRNGLIWLGITLPLPFLVVIFYFLAPGVAMDPVGRVHEHVHVAQDQANAFFLVTWVKYLSESLKQLWKHKSLSGAYRNNKYEVAAYAVQDRIYSGQDPLPDWAAE
jgi:hypothetical protein